MRVTRRGKVVRNKGGRRHLLAKKSRKRKRQLKRKAVITGRAAKKLRKMVKR